MVYPICLYMVYPIPYATMSEICDVCKGMFFMADTDDAQNRWYKKCVACGHRQRELTVSDVTQR